MASSSCVQVFFLALFCTQALTATTEARETTYLGSSQDESQGHYFFYQRSEYPKDCQDVKRQCSTINATGVYVIKPDGFPEPFEAFCDHDLESGGWTVIQRRGDGYINFNRSWSEYGEGFGYLRAEYWMGMNKLSYITNQALYELRMDIELTNGQSFYSSYKGFRIADEFGQHKLGYVGTIESNAGTVLSSCPTNMKYGPCACQATCQDPTGEDGCYSVCSDDEGCICPGNFLINGSDCINASECGCFLTDVAVVIPDGGTHVNAHCTRLCSCSNDYLTCDDTYACHADATCQINNGVARCTCNEGFEGDGQTCEALYTDCKDVYDAGNTQDGVYTIMPSGWPHSPFSVYCKMENGLGWTVFQRRVDGTTNFARTWTEYRQGFGDLNHFTGDFWLGNEKLHYITNQKRYRLRYDSTSSSGSSKYAEFTEFGIESEASNYRLDQLSGHSGTDGHNFIYYSKDKQFSTYDRDNDGCGNFNCAEKHRSGWWHSNNYCSYTSCNACRCFQYASSSRALCTDHNLNGAYDGSNAESIFTYYSSPSCNVRSIEMKIRPFS